MMRKTLVSLSLLVGFCLPAVASAQDNVIGDWMLSEQPHGCVAATQEDGQLVAFYTSGSGSGLNIASDAANAEPLDQAHSISVRYGTGPVDQVSEVKTLGEFKVHNIPTSLGLMMGRNPDGFLLSATEKGATIFSFDLAAKEGTQQVFTAMLACEKRVNAA